MDEMGIAYLAFCSFVLLVGLSMIPYIGKGIIAIVVLIIVLIGAALIMFLNFADFLLVSMVFGALGITFQPAQGYKITKEQNAIIKNINGLSYATGYITANLFAYSFKLETAEGGEDESKLLTSPDTWERAVMNVGFPFKYHVLSMGLDVQKVRDELEGKRSYQEFQMSRALQSSTTNDVTITNIQRKINIIQAEIDRISQGEKPIATVMYIETTAIGVSEKAAIDALAQHINGIQIAFSSMDVDLQRVVGRELYTLFRFNFAIPTSIEEAASQFDTQQ